ncbi:pyridoxal phosphate-dependent aminotransferase [Patescibacteria group bacterium]
MKNKILSKRVKNISPSSTLEFNAMAQELKSAGHKVVNMSAGQPDLLPPQHIFKAVRSAMKSGFTKYTPAAGIPELKQAIAEKSLKENSLKYTPSQIIITNGGKEALFLSFAALIDPGDEVIIPNPAWVSYGPQVEVWGGKPVYIDGKNYKITPELLEKSITAKTKALVLNYPSNPTGVTYNRKELQALAKVIVAKKIWVISDEVYEKFVYGADKHVSIASLGKDIYKKTLMVNAISKTYAIPGWRIGWLAGNEEIIAGCGRLKSQANSNVASLSQYAALKALTGPQDFIFKMVSEFDKRRKALVAGLKEINGIKVALPQGAFYVFVDISQISNNSLAFCKQLLMEEKVASVPGAAFNAEGHMRLSYAVSMEDIKTGLKAIKKFVKKVKND